MTPAASAQSYSRVAVLLHWLIAFLFIGLLGVGFYMARLGDDALSLKFSLYQTHKSFGIILLLLTLFRIGWRFRHNPPAPPGGQSALAHRLAGLLHGTLYVLTLLVPLAGWAMVSASPYNIPTLLFETLPWPHLPPFDTLPDKPAAEAALKLAHRLLAYLAATLALGHMCAAIYHHLILRDAALVRMIPALKPTLGDKMND